MTGDDRAYPGDLASPADLRRLADEYRLAARLLSQIGRRGNPLSRSPYRLSAIHAVELYLNALLLHRGHEAGRIRSLRHDMASRTELALASGLKLRKRTVAHLASMTESREYLVTRYGPEMTASLSQINRLAATLEEVAAKTSAIIGQENQGPSPS